MDPQERYVARAGLEAFHDLRRAGVFEGQDLNPKARRKGASNLYSHPP